MIAMLRSWLAEIRARAEERKAREDAIEAMLQRELDRLIDEARQDRLIDETRQEEERLMSEALPAFDIINKIRRIP